MELEKVIRERHATRKFQERKIEREKLESILEAARLAPTAKNIQPIKILVVEEEIDKIDLASPCRYGAQTVLIVCGNKEECFEMNNHSTLEIDVSIVATHIMLEATNLGIANIWIEMFDRDVLKRELNIPENLVPVCLIPIGYEEENLPENPNHFKRKDLEEIVEYR